MPRSPFPAEWPVGHWAKAGSARTGVAKYANLSTEHVTMYEK